MKATKTVLFREVLPKPAARMYHATGKEVGIRSVTSNMSAEGGFVLETRLQVGSLFSANRGRYWLVVPQLEGIRLVHIAVWSLLLRAKPHHDDSERFLFADPSDKWKRVLGAMNAPDAVKVDVLGFHPHYRREQAGEVPDVR